MSNDNNQPLAPAEHAELLQQFPRYAYWVRAAANHPDIHPQDQADPAPSSFDHQFLPISCASNLS